MRIMSFSQRWPKLLKDEFTTFRYPRVDKDWYIGEYVQVYYKNRSPQRERICIAEIINKEIRELEPAFATPDTPLVTEEEAKEDGFESRAAMVQFMSKQYGLDYIARFQKLTLKRLIR